MTVQNVQLLSLRTAKTALNSAKNVFEVTLINAKEWDGNQRRINANEVVENSAERNADHVNVGFIYTNIII